MLSAYPACFFQEENGYSVIFPDLNYLATCGDTLEDAFASAVDCLAGYLHTAQMEGDTVPAPSPLAQINPVSVARALDPDAPTPENFVSFVTVDVEEYARLHFCKSVKKTLSIPAWMDASAKRLGVNFSQVLQDALRQIIEQQ